MNNLKIQELLVRDTRERGAMKETITTRIPDRWLQGRCLFLERHCGFDPRAAIEQAICDWKEQERLEANR